MGSYYWTEFRVRGSSESEGDVTKEERSDTLLLVVLLKMEEGAVSQEMRAPSSSSKGLSPGDISKEYSSANNILAQ